MVGYICLFVVRWNNKFAWPFERQIWLFPQWSFYAENFENWVVSFFFSFFFLGGCGGVEELGGPGVFVVRIPITFIAGFKLPVNVLWYQDFHFTKLNYITCIEEYNVVMVIGFDTNWQIGNNFCK